ncbi:MAG TPA: Clp protease N-terminal domain-containing protein [Terriglobales bacterium]|nr:Clp protease N-terminal domain-containing protein [Terriglobales bacterium]
MFERYTEGARRTIFFARYEASQVSSSYIETEHLLLGLLREDKALFRRVLPEVSYESIHQEVIKHTKTSSSASTSGDLPLSDEGKRALSFAAEEADRLSHRHIGTEHLLLGLLREGKHPAAELLAQRGANIEKLREEISKLPTPWFSGKSYPVPGAVQPGKTIGAVEIHGYRWNADYVHDAVKQCREYNWHWHKSAWKPRDIAVDIRSGCVSFDLDLAKDSANFRLVKEGWKKDHCIICRWELSESPADPERGIGYTNGRDWLCSECYEKFVAPGAQGLAPSEN